MAQGGDVYPHLLPAALDSVRRHCHLIVMATLSPVQLVKGLVPPQACLLRLALPAADAAVTAHCAAGAAGGFAGWWPYAWWHVRPTEGYGARGFLGQVMVQRRQHSACMRSAQDCKCLMQVVLHCRHARWVTFPYM
jgi:hypothetical protein